MLLEFVEVDIHALERQSLLVQGNEALQGIGDRLGVIQL
jgi:hypothetical protein